MSPSNLLIAAVAIIAVVLGAWLSYGVDSAPEERLPRYATLLSGANTLANFNLADHTGAPVGPGVFEGQWDLVFFGFTHCPDICPLTLQVLSTARDELSDTGFDPLPRIVLVSVDPERDTPELLAKYIAYFGDDNLGITGDLAEVRKLTDSLGIFFDKNVREDGNYLVDHSSAVLLIDPNGEFRALFSSPHEPGNYVHDIPLIVEMQ